MSVIAWDGRYLAVDRAATIDDLKVEIRKYCYPYQPRADSSIRLIAWCGRCAAGLLVADWLLAGADPDKWPEVQRKDDNYATVIVIDKDGQCTEYGCEPVPITIAQPEAWGSGANVAMGALDAGANAIRAVQIACQRDPFCGFGVDVFDTKTERLSRVAATLP